jgi:hypothetical protein
MGLEGGKSQFSGKVREEAERDIQVRSAWSLQVPVWSDRRAELGAVQLQQGEQTHFFSLGLVGIGFRT